MPAVENTREMVRITLPGGSTVEQPRGVTPMEVAESLDPHLAREAVCARVDGRLVDLYTPVDRDSRLEILTAADPAGLEVLRHSTAHLLAQAVKRLYPGAKLAIGPPVENGFYYDIEFPGPVSSDDLPRIEAEMDRIRREDLPVRREELDRAAAVRLFQELGETYKLEILRDLPPGETASVYRQGEFVDLCRGPHVVATGRLGAFKLLSLAGAYWRGDPRGPVLTRVYGTAWPTRRELEEHLHLLEEAARRDHRRLGRELGLFSTHEEGPGFPFLLPKGMAVYNTLIDFWRREHRRRGYQEIRTPMILAADLWKQSGHWDHYRENMYFTEIDGRPYAVKPMNCPGSTLVYREGVRSYRDLPLRLAEMGVVHRHELSGVLHGLMRVRAFTLDDAHLYVTPDQIPGELDQVVEFLDTVYTRVFGFPYTVELSTRPEGAMGDPALWDRAEAALRAVLEARGMSYRVNEGEGAFYGPKIDFHLRDSLGRYWQCGTVQLDFQMPEAFDLTYVGPDGQRHRPVMIHRAIFGSLERFMGVLIEHYAGAFPFWLAPVQVRVLPVADRHLPYAREVAAELVVQDFRAETDDRGEKLGYKIREAQLQKIPFMVVVGDREVSEGAVAVRHREHGDLGRMSRKEFLERLRREAGPGGADPR